MKLRIYTLLIAFCAAWSLHSCDNDDDESIAVPTPLQEAFSTRYPNVKNVKWETKAGYYVGTKSVYLDSLMLEKNTRKERRTRIVHTKSRGAGERKFRQEVVIDHAGWMKEFNRYVADSLRYPEDARLEKLQGEIQLTVRLNRKGLPARIKLIQRLSPSCNREAIRLVEEYPGKWENTEKEILLTIPFKLPVTE